MARIIVYQVDRMCPKCGTLVSVEPITYDLSSHIGLPSSPIPEFYCSDSNGNEIKLQGGVRC